MITLRNLEKSVKAGGGELFLLRRINLDVKPGDFVSIMGPSGAGKSTLLHILGMHDADWRGEYELCGQPVHTLRQKDRLALLPFGQAQTESKHVHIGPQACRSRGQLSRQ